MDSSQSKHNTEKWFPAAETVLSNTARTTAKPASPSKNKLKVKKEGKEERKSVSKQAKK